MKYTLIPTNTFQRLQMNAGAFFKTFNPATGEYSGLLGATTGGASFTAAPEFSDFGEDIDNCPKNTMELKRQDDVTCTMSGTFVTIDPETAKVLMGAADIDGTDLTHLIPRRDLSTSDFSDVWWVGDYSNINTGTGAGFCAIHLRNALSTGGFQVQSTDKGKGNFAFELTGHYSISAQDVVPYEVWIKAGSEEGETPVIELEVHSASVVKDETITLNVARLTPAGTTVTWSSSSNTYATVSGGVVTGEAAGSAIITASITVDDVTYTDTCTVVVTAAA